MTRRRTVFVLCAVLLLASCSTNRYGMKKKKRRKCDCPTFSMVLPETDAERISAGNGC